MNGLNVRIAFAKAKLSIAIFGADSFEDSTPDEMWQALFEAEMEGFHAGTSGEDMPVLFRGEQPLEYFWTLGRENAIDVVESLASHGTQVEWEALSEKQQAAEWDDFHRLDSRGIADEMYFYRVLMDMHLVGYVGH